MPIDVNGAMESGARRGRIPSILVEIVAKKRRRLARARKKRPLDEVRAEAGDRPAVRDFTAAVGRKGDAVNIIAEMKRRSPSKGLLRADFDIGRLHRAYEEGGADAFPILTEEDHFDGSLDYIPQIRRVTGKPILRKDFVFDPYQIYETRACGADAVLLIAAMLEGRLLAELIDLATDLTLAPLVEVHNEAELEKALEAGARIVGINNRNLHTFEVDLAVTESLRGLIPGDRVVISESGINGPADISRLVRAGVNSFLTGEHLMRADDISKALRELKGAS